MRLVRALSVAPLLLAACGKCNREPAAKDAAIAESPRGRPDGVAYLAVADVGVVRVADGAIRTAYESKAAIREVVVGPDRAAYVLAGTDVVRIDGSGSSVLATTIFAEHLAVASDGVVYAAGRTSVHRIARGVTSAIPLGSGRGCKYVAVDARDVLHCSLASAGDLGASAPVSTAERWTGTTWEPVPDAGKSNISGLHLGPDGRLVITTAGRFFAIGADGAAKRLDPPAESTVFTMRPTPGGDALVWGTPTSFVMRRDGSWRALELASRAAFDPSPAVDGLGRVWFVPKTRGLAVLDSGTTTAWPACSAFGAVVDLAVAGNGPPMPAELPKPIRGPVRGRLVRNKRALANADVLMTSPAAALGLNESEACAIKGSSAPELGFVGPTERTRTDAEGRFEMKDIPRGPKALVLVEGKPLVLRADCCGQMKDATGVDLGTIAVP